jgi:hypothetical protein
MLMVFNHCSKVRECRYCLQGGGIMVAPCNCSGYTKWVHVACLAEWHHKKDSYTCEICLGDIRLSPRVLWEMWVVARVYDCLSCFGYLLLYIGVVWPRAFNQWLLLIVGHVCVFLSVSTHSEYPLYRWLLQMHQWPVLTIRLVLCVWRPWHFLLGDIACIVVFHFVNHLAL